MKRAVLTLALGDSTGWALRAADGRITSGMRHLRPTRYDADQRFDRFRLWLSDVQATVGGIGAVHYEVSRRLFGADAKRAYERYIAGLAEWCASHGVRCHAVPASQIKRHVTGSSNGSKTGVVARMRAQGHDLAGDGEGLALALLSLVTQPAAVAGEGAS